MRTFQQIIKIVFIVAGLILTLLFFYGLYFVTQFSAVYDPLKSYTYSLTRNELKETLIQTTKEKSKLNFILTDSTGTDKKDLNYYADILIKTETEEYEFNILYKKKDSFWDKTVKSEISLIGVFDKVHKTGGYETNDPDVGKLINIFENEFLKELEGGNTNRK